MKLFLGLIEPKNGSIFFDTTSGKIDITSGTRRMFSYVPQGNFILSGTIKENISFASPNATDEQLKMQRKMLLFWIL